MNDTTAAARPDSEALFATASEQAGYFTAAQARAAGYSWPLLSYHARHGRFVRVARGLYRLRDYPSSTREELIAAWLRLGPDAAISHESALEMLDLSDIIPDSIHLTVPRARRRLARQPGVTTHTTTRPLDAADVFIREGLRLTTPARTIVDVAESGAAPEQVIKATRQAIGRGLTTPVRMRAAARSRSRRVRNLVESALSEMTPEVRPIALELVPERRRTRRTRHAPTMSAGESMLSCPRDSGLAKPARPICTVLAICTTVVQLARMVEVERGDQLERAFEDALRKALPPGWEMTLESEGRSGDSGVDAYLDLVPPSGGRFRACVEFKARAEPADVVRLVPWLQQCGPAVLVAPAVGSRTRDILAEAGISWMEPEGDCRIALGSLFIERLGRDRPRRMAGASDTRYVYDLFSGGALRVVRWLLIEPSKSWTLADMAERTGLTLGFVSRTFKTLARDAYLDRTRGSSRVRDRDALLDAWAAAPAAPQSAFERVATVDGPEALLRMIRAFTAPRPYAITAEAAADKVAPFARFSRVEMYVQDVAGWDRALGLTSVPRGGNLVLIKPADTGVFDGSFERDGVLLTSRPQLYVDLVRRGGAAAEAAAFMRERGELWPQ